MTRNMEYLWLASDQPLETFKIDGLLDDLEVLACFLDDLRQLRELRVERQLDLLERMQLRLMAVEQWIREKVDKVKVLEWQLFEALHKAQLRFLSHNVGRSKHLAEDGLDLKTVQLVDVIHIRVYDGRATIVFNRNFLRTIDCINSDFKQISALFFSQ